MDKNVEDILSKSQYGKKRRGYRGGFRKSWYGQKGN